jgi:hypothetical protein
MGKNDANVPIIPADITLPSQSTSLKITHYSSYRHPKGYCKFFIYIFFMM